MTDIKFVEGLPPQRPGSSEHREAPYLRVLRAEPGRWAEIARYPLSRRGSAASRGNQATKRNPDIEYAVRAVGDEIVLYMRAVAR